MSSLPDLLRLASVVFGIGLVIFVHELGHYLAARLCRVRVEVFSLGFGPKLVGWRRGATLYQIAVVPLGGYVRMAGEERRRDGGRPLPDELPAKSVGQRFFIYSGGVLSNFAFALVVFPILFHVGVPFLRPAIGEPAPGSPAWHAGLREGSEVLAVDGDEVIDFSHIATSVALADPDRTELRVRDPETGAVSTVVLDPEYQKDRGFQTIGVVPALDRDASGAVAIEVDPDSPAWEAGLRSGERLVEVEDALPGLSIFDQIADRTFQGAPLALLVKDAAGGVRRVELVPRLSEEPSSPRVGISPPRNLVLGVRDSALTRALRIRGGDLVLAVQGRPVRRLGDLRRALLEVPGPLALRVWRDGRELELTGPAVDRDEALALAGDLALTQDLETSAIVVTPGEAAAEAGLLDGDRVRRIDEAPVEGWEDVTSLVRRAAEEERPAVFAIERPGAAGGPARFLDVAVEPRARPYPIYGLNLRQAEYVYRADGFFDALHVGAACSWKFLEETWLTLKRILLAQVSAENVGGIITIGAVSYSLAEAGLAKLFFFLCVLSINLAFLNVLPIPVLDGGHLFFLLIEKIKGSPVSDRVLGYSQMVGLVLILSLMVYVTYNDLVRWVFPG
jgi:regulator of sigma E protease